MRIFRAHLGLKRRGREGWNEDSRQKYRDRNRGPALVCRSSISVLNIVVKTPAPPFLGPIRLIRDHKSPSLLWNSGGEVQRFLLFCVSCAFLRLSPALPVSDSGRSFYRGWHGWEREPVPRTYICRVIAAAVVGGALTRRRYPFRLSPRTPSHSLLIAAIRAPPIFAFSKKPILINTLMPVARLEPSKGAPQIFVLFRQATPHQRLSSLLKNAIQEPPASKNEAERRKSVHNCPQQSQVRASCVRTERAPKVGPFLTHSS